MWPAARERKPCRRPLPSFAPQWGGGQEDQTWYDLPNWAAGVAAPAARSFPGEDMKIIPIASERGAFPFFEHRTWRAVRHTEYLLKLAKGGRYDQLTDYQYTRLSNLLCKADANNPPPPTEPDDAA
jgi:hypothetical protein